MDVAVPLREREFLGHPIGLTFLSGTEMWERFCFYGMRALLTFYMVDFLFQNGEPQHILGYGAVKQTMEAVYGPLGPQPLAALVYGTYTSGTYLTTIIGGAIADRFLGQRWSVMLGAVIMSTGEFLLTSPAFFFIGLLVLLIGTGFVKPNITTQVGGLYKPGDPRIDRAYSIFYMMFNLGAAIAPPICGRLGHAPAGQVSHWGYGFGAAGIGMLIGLVIFILGQRSLPPDVRARRKIAEAHAGATSKLTARDKKAVLALCLVTLCNLFFWGCYEQQGITIALMAEQNTNLHTWFGTLAPEDVQSFNPVLLFPLTPLIITFWSWQAKAGREPSPVTKMGIGCALTALCFGLLVIPAYSIDAGAKVAVWWLVAAMVAQTLGELYLSPVSLSLFSRAAPAKLASFMMGVNFLSNFAGNYLAGYLGSFWSGMSKVHFFAMIAGISGATALAIFALSGIVNPILKPDAEATRI
jgi:POT family proton-dependent oligopeptide transporter